jgi:hypothetical protein
MATTPSIADFFDGLARLAESDDAREANLKRAEALLLLEPSLAFRTGDARTCERRLEDLHSSTRRGVVDRKTQTECAEDESSGSEPRRATAASSNRSAAAKTYPCPVCGHVFAVVTTLRLHRRCGPCAER